MCVHKHRRYKRKKPYTIIIIAMLLVGLATILFPLWNQSMEARMDAEEYDLLKAQTSTIGETMPQVVAMAADERDIGATPFAPKTPVPFSGVNLAACIAENEDFIAWIQIPGTPVDYPVVSTDDTDYYLNHTFAGKKSYIGTLFSLGKTDYIAPSQNIAIYGHHIRSNKEVMFSPLLSYKDEAFYQTHKTIYLDSLYSYGAYSVFAAMNMRISDWDPSQASFTSEEDFLAFVNHAKSQSFYDTGVQVTAQDQILTLITCDRKFHTQEGRLVIMAVKQPLQAYAPNN